MPARRHRYRLAAETSHGLTLCVRDHSSYYTLAGKPRPSVFPTAWARGRACLTVEWYLLQCRSQATASARLSLMVSECYRKGTLCHTSCPLCCMSRPQSPQLHVLRSVPRTRWLRIMFRGFSRALWEVSIIRLSALEPGFQPFVQSS
jgi:hypothetical protein